MLLTLVILLDLVSGPLHPHGHDISPSFGAAQAWTDADTDADAADHHHVQSDHDRWVGHSVAALLPTAPQLGERKAGCACALMPATLRLVRAAAAADRSWRPAPERPRRWLWPHTQGQGRAPPTLHTA